jgi:hypothetical protein
MVTVPQLWLPILLAAVAVFIASLIIHMVLPYHRSDVGRMPAEDEVLGAIRRSGARPGEYALPHATMKEMSSPEYVAKRSAGPVALVTVMPGGPPAFGTPMAAWFVYSIVVSIFAGYIAARAVAGGPAVPVAAQPLPDYLDVFRFAGTAAFVGYGLGIWQHSIWWGRPWTTTAKSTFDALIYALLTAGIFGWLWPGGAA